VGLLDRLLRGGPQPWKDELDRTAIDLAVGTPRAFTLRSFEVLTLEATPAR
jgi:hypothetical protein